MKKQELKSFEKIIKAHEKERLEIANKLYEELSKQMNTLKRHFNDIEVESIKNKYQDTDNLIEEANHNIRHIPEAKNYGMLADEGFFKAIYSLADNVLNTYKIKLNVYNNRLNQRLGNSKEVVLFRIINELINNPIPHAKATAVDIHSIAHGNMLNIMGEDNSRGFDAYQNHKTQLMD